MRALDKLCSRVPVLDDDKFGPGNRPYWEMKEGRVSTRYPGLLRALSKIQDPEKRRLLFESHRRKMGSTIGNPRETIRTAENRTISPIGSDFLDNRGSCDASRRLWTAELVCDVLGMYVGTYKIQDDVLCTCRRNVRGLTILEMGQRHVNRNRCCET